MLYFIHIHNIEYKYIPLRVVSSPFVETQRCTKSSLQLFKRVLMILCTCAKAFAKPCTRLLWHHTCWCHTHFCGYGSLHLGASWHHAIFQRVWLPNGSLAWYKFCGLRLQKVVRPCQFLAILVSKLLFRPSVATSWAAGLSRPPVFGSCLCKPTAATQLWTNVAFRAIPTRQNDRVSHVCAVSFLRDHIFCWRIFRGNALYSRKLDSYISIVLSDVNLSDVGYVCLSLPACLVYLPFVSPLLKSMFCYI